MADDGRYWPLPMPEGVWDKPVPTDAATPEQVDVLSMLHMLVSRIPGFIARVITCELRPREWLEIATLLVDAARLCRAQVVVDAPDGGR